MKNTTLTLAVLLMLSGCAELNQSQNPLSSAIKELGKKIKNEDVDTKPTNEMKPVTEMKQVAEPKQAEGVKPVEDVKQILAPQEKSAEKVSTPDTAPTKNLDAVNETSPAKQAPLNISIPKEVLQKTEQAAPTTTMPIQASPSTPAKIDVVKEPKMARVLEYVSIKALNNHHWQINKIFITNNFKASEDHWLFSFSQNGQYKAFGACNFLSGKFKATDEGTFRLGKLETSLNDCPESKDEEVMVFNMLLMADSFALRDEVLLFKSGDKVMMELIPSNQEINVNMSKKSHSKRDKKSKKIKSGQKKETKQKESKKSVKAKSSKDKKQKADKSSASKSTKSSSHKK